MALVPFLQTKFMEELIVINKINVDTAGFFFYKQG